METVCKKRRKTITTFLLSNNPKGIKKVWVANRVCSCIYLTRSELKIAKTRKELNQPALYLLFGEDKEVYIGEAENFNKRIIKHCNNKAFWNEVLVFVAKDNSLSKSEVQYLEFIALKKAKKYNHYKLTNIQTPNCPSLEENKIEIVQEFFEEIVFLSSFLNFNIFEGYPKIEKEKILFCNGKNTKAKGFPDGKKFIVLKDSEITKETVKSYGNDFKKEERNNILSNKYTEEDNYLLLTENIEFSSPSTASSFCLGNSSNGWESWKNEDNETMNEIFRKDSK